MVNGCLSLFFFGATIAGETHRAGNATCERIVLFHQAVSANDRFNACQKIMAAPTAGLLVQ